MYSTFIYPVLRLLDPETAHGLSLKALSLAYRLPGGDVLLHRTFPAVDDSRLEVHACGLTFRNPIGLAAGYDKTGVAAAALGCLGFGSVEVGTVTPLPQAGRPRPRMFRLPEDEALINRLGFPNLGASATKAILAGQAYEGAVRGVNIGPNADHVEVDVAAQDYIACYDALRQVADYFTLNISSPNTKGLRDLHGKAELSRLLDAFFEAIRERALSKPVLLKVSPDLTEAELADVVEAAIAHPIAGFIATNTTVERSASLRGRARTEAGGLSGRPLRAQSTEMVRALFRLTEGRVPIIGVGGVFSVEDVVEKLRAGAPLIQLYTAMVYQGPGIANRLNQGLLAFMDREGVKSVSELVGTE